MCDKQSDFDRVLRSMKSGYLMQATLLGVTAISLTLLTLTYFSIYKLVERYNARHDLVKAKLSERREPGPDHAHQLSAQRLRQPSCPIIRQRQGWP